MLSIVMTLALFAAPSPKDKGPDRPPPRQAPAPSSAVNREQPKNWKHHAPAKPIGGQRAASYHKDHGHRFKHGYYFDGHRHPHWSYQYWDVRYGTTLYWDPGLLTYFYWSRPHFRFYPISYVPAGLTYSYEHEEEPQPPRTPPPAPPPYEGDK